MKESTHPYTFLAIVKEYIYGGLGTSLWKRETVCLLGSFPTERMAFWQRSRCQVKRSRSMNASGSACWARTGCLCAPREAQWTLPSEDGATESNVAKTAPHLLPKGQRGQQHGAERPMKFERYKPQVGQLGRIWQRLDCLNPSRGDATPIRRPN